MQFKQIPLNAYEQKLHDATVEIVRIYKRCDFTLLVTIEEIDRLKLFEKFGHGSTYLYCSKVLKLSRQTCYSLQAVARKSRKVPELIKAVEGGLSLSFANLLVSQITPENQSMWIAKAQILSQEELCVELATANPKKPRKAKKTPLDRKHTRLEIDLPNSTLTKLLRAHEVLGGTEADLIDAALEILLEKKCPVRKADRALKKSAGRDESATQNSSPEEKFCANYEFTPAQAGERVPFRAATYHAVNARDRGECQAKLPDGTKCRATKWVHFHHKIEVANGGTNDPQNLITLCSAHHRIHHGTWRVMSPVVAYVA